MSFQGFKYPHLAARVFNTPLLLHPAKLDAIIAGLGSRLVGADIEVRPSAGASSADMFTTLSGARAERGYDVIDGVAVLSYGGALVHRSQFMMADSSMLIGYNSIAKDMKDAMNNPDVHAIAMVWDSPGGEVAGAFELATLMHSMRGQKRMVSVVDSMMASAAYLNGSAADEVVISPTGMAGSIGVVTRTIDVSRAMANEGVTVNHIYAGAHKIDGNQFEPLSASVRADIQAQVDAIYADFVEAVAMHRPGLSASAIRDTEAAMYRGADAVRAGLADRVGTADQVIAELAALQPGRKSAPRAKTTATGGANMPPEMQSAGLDTDTPQVFTQADVDAARAEGEAAGRAAGSTAERERIQAVEAQAMPGHEALIAEMKFDGKTTGPEAAVAVLNAHRASLSKRREEMHADAPPVLASAEESAGTVAVSYVAPAGYKTSAAGAELHAKAKAYQEQHGCAFTEAVKAVTA